MLTSTNASSTPIGGFLAKVVGALIWSLLIAVASPILDDRFRIRHKINKVRHRNSDAGIKPFIKLEGNFEFEECKSKMKEIVREEYSGINQHNNSSNTLEMTLGEQYRLVMTHNEDTISIYTDRIDSKVKDVIEDFNKFLEVITQFEDELDDSQSHLTIEEYEIDLYLPYIKDYVKVNLPKEFSAENYELEIKHRDYRSKLQLSQDSISLNAESVAQLNKLVKAAI